MDPNDNRDREGEPDQGRAHDPGCAMFVVSAAECTCSKTAKRTYNPGGNIKIPDDAWEDSSGDAPPGSRLLAQMHINGLAFHVEAIEVKEGERGQCAADSSFDHELAGVWAIGGPDYVPGTNMINGREYVVVVTPHGC